MSTPDAFFDRIGCPTYHNFLFCFAKTRVESEYLMPHPVGLDPLSLLYALFCNVIIEMKSVVFSFHAFVPFFVFVFP